jgi:hypothetical protein
MSGMTATCTESLAYDMSSHMTHSCGQCVPSAEEVSTMTDCIGPTYV